MNLVSYLFILLVAICGGRILGRPAPVSGAIKVTAVAGNLRSKPHDIRAMRSRYPP
ncbi:hypothetical protein OO012_14775 [Rhodobacteraceae bacterium KMM 6894]|nr:hypothetical protein [Rhodobacteraceae bacterium KMM 6894]